MTVSAYYECRCGFYHAVGATAVCGEESASFLSEDLDDMHGSGNWSEEFLDEPSEAETIIHRHQNYDRMMALTSETDINGKTIEVGCKVRCFAPTHYDGDHDWFIGLDLAGKTSYIEGRVAEISEYTPHASVPGIHYLINVEKEVSPFVDRTRSDFTVKDTQVSRMANGTAWILANGTIIKGIRVTEKGVFVKDIDAPDWKSFGVLRI